MTLWIIFGIALAAIILSYRFINKENNDKEYIKIKGIVLEKKSGKSAEGTEVILGNIAVNKSDNDFIPFKGQSLITKGDGRFEFEVDKKGVFWIMARRNGKKVLKPLNTEKGDIDDILLTM